jgi:flagellar motor protein MotB
MSQVRKKTVTPDDDDDVPLWLVSFTDMITLLLSFFVLLQSIAHIKDPDLFFIGQGSFRRAVQNFGIPYWLEGYPDSVPRSFVRPKFTMEEDPNNYTKARLLDAEDEKIREIFDQIRQEIETDVYTNGEETIEIRPTQVQFQGHRINVSPESRRELVRVAEELRTGLGGRRVKVYVIGLAPDQPAGTVRWMVSARRARAVEAVLQRILARQLQSGTWTLHSLGAGTSRRWQETFTVSGSPTHIAIAVTGAKYDG